MLEELDKVQKKFVEDFRKIVEEDFLKFLIAADKADKIALLECGDYELEFLVEIDLVATKILGENCVLINQGGMEFALHYTEDGIEISLHLDEELVEPFIIKNLPSLWQQTITLCGI